MQKIDGKGVFQYFPGLTVVSALYNRKYWKKVESFLRKSEYLSQIYSPLPASSYHVTLADVETQYELGEEKLLDWIDEKTESNTWKRIEKILKTFDRSIPLSYGELYTESTIGITVDLGEKDEMFTNARNSIFHILDKPKYSYLFHITFGYMYKRIDKKHANGIKLELDQLEVILDGLGPKLKLHRPKLCIFEDMTKFTPVLL